MELAFDFFAATDVGCKRSNNEDSFGYDLAQQIFVVCDGMGGMAAGEVASALAVRQFIEGFESAEQVRSVAERLAAAIHVANSAVRQAAAASGSLDGMGTTLVCACFSGPQLIVGNVGDSRAYFCRNGQCAQITLDHSLVAEQVRSGAITEEMAAGSTLQSIITRAIGVADEVRPDFFAAELEPGDQILLATDGLTRYLREEELAAMMQAGPDLQGICSKMIGAAKDRGGVDNITCLVVRAGISES